MNREQLQKQSLRRLRRYERQFADSIASALNGQVLSFIADIKKYGIGYAKYANLPTESLKKAIKRLHKYVALSEAEITYTQLKRQGLKRASIGINQVWQQEVQDFLDKYLLDKAVMPISATTRRIILGVLKQANEEGWGTEEILRNLRNLEDANRRRTLTIVRTESVRASNFGHMMGAYDSEFEYTKEWIAVDDPRTRRTHNHMTGVDGQKRDFAEAFSNGLLYPGDPQGKASEVINCRCRVGFRVKRDSKGNPIPKKKPNSPQLRQSLVSLLFMQWVANMVQDSVNDLISGE